MGEKGTSWLRGLSVRRPKNVSKARVCVCVGGVCLWVQMPQFVERKEARNYVIVLGVGVGGVCVPPEPGGGMLDPSGLKATPPGKPGLLSGGS